MYGIGNVQPDLTINSGRSIPARELRVGSEVAEKRGVAGGVHPEILSVEVDGGIPVDALEFHAHAFPGPTCGDREGAAIPCDSIGEVAAAAAFGGIRVHRELDAPIVREIEATPGFGVKGRRFGPGRIVQNELPAGVEEEAFAQKGPE